MNLSITVFLYILAVLADGNFCLPTAKEAIPQSTVLDIISRDTWLAKEPTKPPKVLDLPVPFVIISHTGTQPCFSEIRCAFVVRNIQTFHMESNDFVDIGYNFLIGGAGDVYLGRGWENQGAHTKGYNAISVGIAFIGDFQHSTPTQSQIEACKKLIEQGVAGGYIQKGYKLLGARQLRKTNSPGDKLFSEIKTWEHWAENL